MRSSGSVPYGPDVEELLYSGDTNGDNSSVDICMSEWR